jgi:pyridoxine 5-phosphate synthase
MHLSRRSGPVSRGFGPSGPGLYAARIAIFKRGSRFSLRHDVARLEPGPYLGHQMSGSPSERLRLGVNIDHVATVRNARGSGYPDPVRAALLAAQAGADGITAHLREDRRHITDQDIARLSAELPIPLNLEMAATDEMLEIALRHRPHAACIVPEKREERTTEGGLDAAGQHNHLAPMVRALGAANIRVSLFIEPDSRQIEAALSLGAPVVEIHTGRYCELEGEERATELRRIADAAALAAKNGIEAHAGHGLTFDNVVPIAAIPQIRELNIGHFLIGEAIFDGLAPVVRRMRVLMDEAR